MTENAGTLYVRREPKFPGMKDKRDLRRKKTKPVGSRSLPFRPANQQAALAVGRRLGMDTIKASTRARAKRNQEKKKAKNKESGGGGRGGEKRKPPSSS